MSAQLHSDAILASVLQLMGKGWLAEILANLTYNGRNCVFPESAKDFVKPPFNLDYKDRS